MRKQWTVIHNKHASLIAGKHSGVMLAEWLKPQELTSPLRQIELSGSFQNAWAFTSDSIKHERVLASEPFAISSIKQEGFTVSK